MLCHINTEFKNSGDLNLEGSVPARLGAIIFAFGKEMFKMTMKRWRGRVIFWKIVLSLPPKEKEAHLAFLSNKPSAPQTKRMLGKGLKY